MVTQVVPSADEIYQEDFPKVITLKRSTKGAMSSSFGTVPCT